MIKNGKKLLKIWQKVQKIDQKQRKNFKNRVKIDPKNEKKIL